MKKLRKKYTRFVNREGVSIIKRTGIVVLMINNNTLGKNEKSLIKKIDVKKQELQTAKEKVKEKYQQIGREVRNYFHIRVGASVLKCIIGYNHYVKRNKVVSKGLANSKCLRCKC